MVRERLVAMQRRLGAGGGVVMEGRDIGTVVFPDAPVKIFLDADAARAGAPARRGAARRAARPSTRRRWRRDLAERDPRDSGRAHSPLRPAADASVLDTTGQPFDEVVERMAALRAACLATRDRRHDPCKLAETGLWVAGCARVRAV